MELLRTDLYHLHDLAVSAAREAAELIREAADGAITVERKEAGENLASQVVTEVDRRSEGLILKWLTPTLERYDLGLLTEERDDDRSRFNHDYFWSIDPLDGTLPFIESKPGYAVSIALVARDGTPLVGAVVDPVTGNGYSAVRGEGAWRNGETWHPDLSDADEKSALTLVCDRGLVARDDFPQIETAIAVLAKGVGIESVERIDDGGAVMNAIWVAENRPALYFKLPKPKPGGGSLWDFAATACIFGELGLVASDASGRPLDLNRADATFMNHRGVIYLSDERLSGLVEQFIRGLEEVALRG